MTSKSGNETISADVEVAQYLKQRLDELVAKMKRPGAMEAANKALFGRSVQELAENYRPGVTECVDD